MTTPTRPPRTINLAQPRLGARVVLATDDFFAPKERLIAPADPVFIPGKYDANGKWMDGWETRRRRGPGHDFCVVRLPRLTEVHGFEIDTRHFTGNFPPAASLETCVSEEDIPSDEADWVEVVPVTALKGDDRLGVALPAPVRATHVRLHIYPDGGIARLRVWGRILFDPATTGRDGRIDLAAMEHGGRAVAANDAHFGAPDNLIAPGPGADMGDGWETRRRREPGHDWAILALACPGRIEEVILDTAHFKGNYPDRFSLQAAAAGDVPESLLIVQSQFWPTLLAPTPLGPDAEHRIADGLAELGTVTHVRLNIFPDGGVSRLRLYGTPAL